MGVKRPLSAREKTLAWMFSLYDFNYTLSSVFLTVFLFKKNHDLQVPVFFYLAQFIAIVPAFWIGGHLSKRLGNLMSYQLGFFFSASVYGATLFLRENAPDHPFVLGTLAGFGIGFYFLGEHSLTLEETSEKTRDYFLSLTTFFTSVLCILAPQISGWLIVSFGGSTTGISSGSSLIGYYLVFAMALSLYLVLFFRSFQFKAHPTRRKFDFWRILTLKNTGDWGRLMGAQFFFGLRNGAFWFLVGLLVYRVSNNEAVVGAYSTFANLLGVLTAYGLSRWAKAENRRQGLWISSLLLGAAAIGLSIQVTYFTLFLYAVLAMVGGTWLQIVFGAFSFTILEKAREAKKHRVEYLAVREVPLAAGRILSLVGLYLSQSHFGETGLRCAVLFLGFSHAGLLWLFPGSKIDEIQAGKLKRA
jgi:YQGE family putative transporter